MHKDAQRLIDQINYKIKDSPLFYFSRDIERSLGLEKLLNNYYASCIDKSPIVNSIKESTNTDHVLCLEEENVKITSRSTLELINNSLTKEWILKISNRKPFYAQLFQFNTPVTRAIERLGGKVLNNSTNLNQMFEGKLNQYKVLKDNNIKVPNGFIIESNKTSYKEISMKLGNTFVVQIDKASTGRGTFIIYSEEDWNLFLKELAGNTVKITEYITGEPYTLNGCVTSTGIFIAGLQYQITGYPELTSGKGSTVGNDWSYANDLEKSIKDNIYKITQKIGLIMQKEGFKGLFGIDIIIKDSEVFIIEINARQTANIPMQTKLEIRQNYVPLQVLHLAEFMNIPLDFKPEEEIQPLNGSQVFLRAKKNNVLIKEQLESGIYRLQSDNSAINWDNLKQKDRVIFIDEDKDKPLIWQKDGYSIDDIIEGGFILLIQPKSSTKNIAEEIARMQFTNQIIHSNRLAPWILEAMVEIQKTII